MEWTLKIRLDETSHIRTWFLVLDGPNVTPSNEIVAVLEENPNRLHKLDIDDAAERLIARAAGIRDRD
jgi:hypothetical protein